MPGDVLVLREEAEIAIDMMAKNHVLWPVHYLEKVDYDGAKFLFWMKGDFDWGPNPHKGGGVPYDMVCRATGAMKQTIYDENKNHEYLMFGDWDCGDTEI